MNLYNLPYPLFEVSDAELKLLKTALRAYDKGEVDEPFLCNWFRVHFFDTSYSLRRRIEKSLSYTSTLEQFLNWEVRLFTRLNRAQLIYIRHIWLRKLINHNHKPRGKKDV